MILKAAQSKKKKEYGFFVKLLIKQFDRIHVTIKNVHVRFEDNLSNVKTPFAFGLTLSNLIFNASNFNRKSKIKFE